MSLTAGIIAELRKSPEPLTSADLRKRLGNDLTMGDVAKRVGSLADRGILQRVGTGREVRFALVPGDRTDQLQLRAAGRGETVLALGRTKGGPTFREHILQIVENSPGISCAGITAALVARGVAIAANEPSSSINVLGRQGRVAALGIKPNRRYYLPIDLPDTGAGLQAYLESSAQLITTTAPITGAGVVIEPPEAKPIAASAPVAPPPAATLPPMADDPIDRLADSIESHLGDNGGWLSSLAIAREFDEPLLDVAKALRRLLDSKRASLRVVGDRREYCAGIVAPAPSMETGPLADSSAPIAMPSPLPETQTGLGAGASEGAAVAPITAASAGSRAEVQYTPDPATASTAHTPVQRAQARAIRQLIDDSTAALSDAPIVDAARWLQSDIEDLVGRACDHRAPHNAIKSLSAAAFALARAITHLHPAGNLPAPTGVNAP